MQGYAVAKRTNIEGARKTATRVPIPWANHCRRGEVRRRKPTLKSPVKSAAWFAPIEARAPPRRLSFCAEAVVQSGPEVVPPRIIWEAFEAAESGVMSTGTSEKLQVWSGMGYIHLPVAPVL